jgi:hypothetical protein
VAKELATTDESFIQSAILTIRGLKVILDARNCARCRLDPGPPRIEDRAPEGLNGEGE